MSIDIKQAYYNALYNKTDEQKRLSTPTSLDDYFKKQQATKEAMEHLQNGGTVPPDVAKLVDVNELKKQIESAKNGEEKSSLASSIGGGRGLNDSVDIKGELAKPDQAESYAKCCQQAALNAHINQGEEQKISELAEKYGVPKEDIKSFLEQKSVNTNKISEPDDASNIYNPLEKTEDKASSPYDVSFTDDYSGKEVTVTLSPENAAKLQERFGSLDKASDLVKSWYNDAAYNVGYLTQDADGDGKISTEEAVNINSLVDIGKGENSYSSIAKSISDPGEQQKFLEQFGYIDNINDFINHSISQDTNYDGALTNSELLGEQKYAVADVALSGEEVDVFSFNSMLFERPANDRENVALFAKRAGDEIVDSLIKNNTKPEKEV